MRFRFPIKLLKLSSEENTIIKKLKNKKIKQTYECVPIHQMDDWHYPHNKNLYYDYEILARLFFLSFADQIMYSERI